MTAIFILLCRLSNKSYFSHKKADSCRFFAFYLKFLFWFNQLFYRNPKLVNSVQFFWICYIDNTQRHTCFCSKKQAKILFFLQLFCVSVILIFRKEKINHLFIFINMESFCPKFFKRQWVYIGWSPGGFDQN